MKKRLLMGCAVIAGIFIIGLLGLLIYWTYLGIWYKQVQSALPEVKQKLIVLNHAVISQIPIPNGVSEINKEDRGVNSPFDYGISTKINYFVDNSEVDIPAYYRSILDQLHWTLLRAVPYQNTNRWIYYSGSVCLEVNADPENKKGYSILVYHDFQKQAFSPKFPPDWYMGFSELGKTRITTCPWK